MKYAAVALLLAFVVSFAGNAVLIWRLSDARQDEATALQACETRIEAGARAASEAAREALQAAHDRRIAEIEAESARATAATAALRNGIEAIAEQRDGIRTQLRKALATTVDDCAVRPVPAALLLGLRPN